MLIWFLLSFARDKPQLALAAVDLQTVFAAGFGYAMLRGRQAKWRSFWTDAGGAYFVLLLLNVGIYLSTSIGAAIPARLRPAWGILIGVLLKFGTDIAAKWLEHLWHGDSGAPIS